MAKRATLEDLDAMADRIPGHVTNVMFAGPSVTSMEAALLKLFLDRDDRIEASPGVTRSAPVLSLPFRVVPADPANPPDPRNVAAIEKAISVETDRLRDSRVREQRREIDALIAEDARRYPAFARARFAAVMAYIEYYDAHGRACVSIAPSLLTRLREHEDDRRNRRPAFGVARWEDSPVVFEQTAIAVYERERGRCM